MPFQTPVQQAEEVADDYGGYGTSQGAEPEGLKLRYYLGVLLKRRWSAFTAFVMVFTAVVVHNFTAVPQYQASARVLVEFEQLNPVVAQDVFGPVDPWRSLDPELAVLESRWLAKRTVESLGLLVPEGQPTVDTDNETGDAVGDGSRTWSNAWAAIRTFASKSFGVGTPVPDGSLFPDASPQAGEQLSGERPAEAARINAFLGGLSVSFGEASAVLDITYRSSNPALTARFANSHAQQYIDQNIERRFAAIEEVTDWMAVRLAEQRQKVDASEQALARFREENGLTRVEGASPTLTRLNGLTTSLTQTQAERLEKEAVYNQALSLRGDPESLDQLPLMANDPILQQRRVELRELRRQRSELGATLRDRHPEMLKLQEEIQRVQVGLETDRVRLIESLGQDILAVQSAEAGLAEALESLKSDAIRQDRKGVQDSVLVREVESDRQIYDLLVERAQVTGVAKDINPIRTRILDQALVPRVPFSPNRQRNILNGVGGGFLLAIAVAFGLERLDNRVRSPTDVSDYLGLPFIGLLPEVTGKDKSMPLLAINGSLPQFSEELRHIRTNLLFSFSGDEPRSVVVSSAGPGEGKTVFATNLAVALAQTGERVLLVDADMRLPSVHTTFPVPLEPGLSNVLVGGCKLSQAVQQCGVDNLWVLPAGRRPPNPSELLGSKEFTKLVGQLGRHFSWILFDAPPVIAVTDPSVVAHVVSGVVFVTGADRVGRQEARRAVDQLTRAGGNLVGGVLSRVALNRNRHYYSSYSVAYGQKYSDYYRAPLAPRSSSESNVA